MVLSAIQREREGEGEGGGGGGEEGRKMGNAVCVWWGRGWHAGKHEN